MKGSDSNFSAISKERPLRICFLFASLGWGGAEKSMLQLMRSTHPLQMQCLLLVCRTGPAPLVEQARQSGIPVKQLKTAAFSSLASSLREFAPDLVYLFGHIRTVLWAWAARWAGIRTCIGAERGSGTRWLSRCTRYLDRGILKGYITNSRAAALVLTREMGIPEHRVAVIYNGVEEPAFEPPPPPPGLEWGHPSVICVANLLPNKGQAVLLRAIRLLRRDYPSIRAMLAGRDLSGGQFFEQVRAEGLEDTFTWAGFVPEVRGLLRRASVFVLPSLVREGMPLSLVEAMFERIPVVGTQVGGVAELIRHGQNGFLVDPGRPDQIAAALKLVLASPARANALGQAGGEFVRRHCTMKGMIEGHLRAFDRFLHQDSGKQKGRPECRCGAIEK